MEPTGLTQAHSTTRAETRDREAPTAERRARTLTLSDCSRPRARGPMPVPAQPRCERNRSQTVPPLGAIEVWIPCGPVRNLSLPAACSSASFLLHAAAKVSPGYWVRTASTSAEKSGGRVVARSARAGQEGQGCAAATVDGRAAAVLPGSALTYEEGDERDERVILLVGVLLGLVGRDLDAVLRVERVGLRVDVDDEHLCGSGWGR